jgi:hypothetical protein
MRQPVSEELDTLQHLTNLGEGHQFEKSKNS